MSMPRTLAVSAIALMPIAAPLALVTPASAHDGHHSADKTVNFTLNELNDSGASAEATVMALDDGSLHVLVEGTGFTPDSPHAQHIHGAVDGHDFFCPPASADANGDGQVSTEEGLPQYGDVFVSLTTQGDTSKQSGLAVDRMPIADSAGNLSYDRVIPASVVPEGTVENLEHLHLVQHGLDVNGNDAYDMKALGESVFAQSLGVNGIPEEATNPATCGEVTPTGGVETGTGPTKDSSESMPGLMAGGLALGGLAVAGAAGGLALRRRAATDNS